MNVYLIHYYTCSSILLLFYYFHWVQFTPQLLIIYLLLLLTSLETSNHQILELCIFAAQNLLSSPLTNHTRHFCYHLSETDNECWCHRLTKQRHINKFGMCISAPRQDRNRLIYDMHKNQVDRIETIWCTIYYWDCNHSEEEHCCITCGLNQYDTRRNMISSRDFFAHSG